MAGKKFSVSVIVVEELKFREFSITRLNLLALENRKINEKLVCVRETCQGFCHQSGHTRLHIREMLE